MTKEQPIISMTANYELREVAKLLDVSASSIIRWTKDGKMRSGVKRINGRRCWSGKEILRVWRNMM